MLKICAYAICKNEEKNVERWLWATRHCQSRIVVDTGSTDRSVELLRKAGVEVHEARWDPFRFDEARNLALRLTPPDADWLISPDFDECFEDGWIEELEQVSRSHPTATLVEYKIFLVGADKTRIPGQNYGRKIHRPGYRWVQPVHEYLALDKPEVAIRSEVIVQLHEQDLEKDREGHYLDLALAHLARDPESEWLTWFVFRGYCFIRRDLDRCIEYGTKYLQLSRPYSTFRSIALEEIARASWEKDLPVAHVLATLLRAVGENPDSRSAWHGLGDVAFSVGKWDLAVFAYSVILDSDIPELLNKYRHAVAQISGHLEISKSDSSRATSATTGPHSPIRV